MQDLFHPVFLVPVGFCAIIIPPSTILVLYGAGGASVSNYSLQERAGVHWVLYCVHTSFIAQEKQYGAAQGQSFHGVKTWSKFKSQLGSCNAIIVLGSIYAGITTPTEAAVIASIYGYLLVCSYIRMLSLKISLL